MSDFIPTLGNLIKECDAILVTVHESFYPDYASLFDGTLIELVIFSGESFDEAASEWARDNGWKEAK